MSSQVQTGLAQAFLIAATATLTHAIDHRIANRTYWIGTHALAGASLSCLLTGRRGDPQSGIARAAACYLFAYAIRHFGPRALNWCGKLTPQYKGVIIGAGVATGALAIWWQR